MVRADVTTVGWEGANASTVLACMQNRAMKRRKMERIMILVGFCCRQVWWVLTRVGGVVVVFVRSAVELIVVMGVAGVD